MPRGLYERKNSIRAGEQYGDWTTISRATEPRNKQGIRWTCVCICGTQRDILSRTLKSGQSTGCGCRQRETQRSAVTRHGQSRSPVYKVWTAMHQRCTNPRSQIWKYYGARGISVDPRWDDFATFAHDMGPRPPKHTLERRDNDGNYCAENCYWATSAEQTRNTSQNRKLTFNGETRTVSEWAVITGIHRATIDARIRQGKPVEQALTVMPNYRRKVC